jgi:predicted nucleotide-binding protein
MDISTVRALLLEANFMIGEEKEIPHGFQFRLTNGGIVNLFNTGRISVQGSYSNEIGELLGLAGKPVKTPQKPISVSRFNDEVFVVYGHDTDARTQLEAMLRRWNIKPLILDQLPSEGQTIIEKLEKHTSSANFCVVLATPDDIGYRKDHDEERAFRARQNVVLELGMMLAKLGRERVAILLKGQEKMERPSDIHGLIYIPFKDDVKDAALLLAKEMAAQGYNINIKDL